MKKTWLMLPLIAITLVACGKKDEAAAAPLPAPAVAPSLAPAASESPTAAPVADKPADLPSAGMTGDTPAK